MNKKNAKSHHPHKQEAAICGLFCRSCSIFIGTAEEPERLSKLAAIMNQSVEAMRCEGCRSSVRTSYCKTCKMYTCASEKGIDFCVECSDYPCEEIKNFQSIMPHRLELWQSQARIKEAGWEQWYREMVEHYSCSECGTINSAYDRKCRNCGTAPSCEYVRVNKEGIAQRMPDRI
ncbi:MAG: DUF3795 domain-containing protein [Chloroflexi bacterium]|nr:DUF3795 domain-containing protein [Chloroflexota bacterium]